MSWIEFKTDTRGLLPVLARIADALDRIAPPPDASVPDIKPEDAVTYADEDKLQREEAIRELGEEAQRLHEWLQEHPEEADADVQQPRD